MKIESGQVWIYILKDKEEGNRVQVIAVDDEDVEVHSMDVKWDQDVLYEIHTFLDCHRLDESNNVSKILKNYE